MESEGKYTALQKLKDLLNAGILSEEEFKKEKAKILAGPDVKQHSDILLTPESKKKVGIWILITIAAIIGVISYLQDSGYVDSNAGTFILQSNPYREIDNYIANMYSYSREGTCVYVYEYDNDTGEVILIKLLKSPQTVLGKMLSVGLREVALKNYIEKDPHLFMLIAEQGLSFCIVLNGEPYYSYTPDEIKGYFSTY